jgi:hypothetical protein
MRKSGSSHLFSALCLTLKKCLHLYPSIHSSIHLSIYPCIHLSLCFFPSSSFVSFVPFHK